MLLGANISGSSAPVFLLRGRRRSPGNGGALPPRRTGRGRDEIEVLPEDIFPGVSEIAKRWPRQRRFKLDGMLELMVASSGNTAVETLFRIGGGPAAVAGRLRQWGAAGIRIDRTERACAVASAGVEHVPPAARWADGALEQLTSGVPPGSRYAAMRRFIAGPRDTATPDATVRLLAAAFRGEPLPANGLNGATNDVGVITLPTGQASLRLQST